MTLQCKLRPRRAGRLLALTVTLLTVTLLTVTLLLATGPAFGETSEEAAGATGFERVYQYHWGRQGDADGQFLEPTGIAVFTKPSGQTVLVVADTGNHRLRNYTSDGMFIDKWGLPGPGDGQFYLPMGVAIDRQGDLLVADTANHRIQKTRISTRTLMDVPGKPLGQSGRWGSGGGEFDRPEGLAVDAEGHLYVADTGNRRVQKLAADGSPLAAWGEGLIHPAGIAVGLSGDAVRAVYLVDAGSHRVLAYDPEGKLLRQWGGQGDGPGQFQDPWGVAVDAEGRVYVADTGNHRVQVFDGEGRLLATLGRRGREPGELLRPRGVAVDGAGKVYVTDSGNHRVQVYGPP